MSYYSLVWQQVQDVWSPLPSDRVVCFEAGQDATEDVAWTWKHVHEAVLQVRNALIPHLRQHEDTSIPPRVAIITHPGVDHVIAALGTLAAGCVYWIWACMASTLGSC